MQKPPSIFDSLIRVFVVGLLACAALLSMSTHAYADWDPMRFVQLQEVADKNFTTGKYEAALPDYLELKVMIETGLESGEIPEDQREVAETALSTIHYQIGRCLQLTGDCVHSLAAFKDVKTTERINDDVVAKLPTRMAQVTLCIAKAEIRKGDFDNGQRALGQVQALLKRAERVDHTKALSELDAKRLTQEQELVTEQLNKLGTDVYTHYSASSNQLAAAERCDEASLHANLAEGWAPKGKNQEMAALRALIDENCSSDTGGGEGFTLPLGPVITVSAGAALVIGGGIYEGILTPTISDYDNARDSCERGEPTCEDAIALAGDIETGRIISAALFGAGGAAIIGGAIWWILDDSPSEPATTSFDIMPSRDGGFVRVNWTF